MENDIVDIVLVGIIVLGMLFMVANLGILAINLKLYTEIIKHKILDPTRREL